MEDFILEFLNLMERSSITDMASRHQFSRRREAGRFRASARYRNQCRSLVDVVLVLLIIFMLTAHVMEFGLEVESRSQTHPGKCAGFAVVVIAQDGTSYLADKPVNINLMAMNPKRYRNAKSVYLKATADALDQVAR